MYTLSYPRNWYVLRVREAHIDALCHPLARSDAEALSLAQVSFTR